MDGRDLVSSGERGGLAPCVEPCVTGGIDTQQGNERPRAKSFVDPMGL